MQNAGFESHGDIVFINPSLNAQLLMPPPAMNFSLPATGRPAAVVTTGWQAAPSVARAAAAATADPFTYGSGLIPQGWNVGSLPASTLNPTTLPEHGQAALHNHYIHQCAGLQQAGPGVSGLSGLVVPQVAGPPAFATLSIPEPAPSSSGRPDAPTPGSAAAAAAALAASLADFPASVAPCHPASASTTAAAAALPGTTAQAVAACDTRHGSGGSGGMLFSFDSLGLNPNLRFSWDGADMDGTTATDAGLAAAGTFQSGSGFYQHSTSMLHNMPAASAAAAGTLMLDLEDQNTDLAQFLDNIIPDSVERQVDLAFPASLVLPASGPRHLLIHSNSLRRLSSQQSHSFMQGTAPVPVGSSHSQHAGTGIPPQSYYRHHLPGYGMSNTPLAVPAVAPAAVCMPLAAAEGAGSPSKASRQQAGGSFGIDGGKSGKVVKRPASRQKPNNKIKLLDWDGSLMQMPGSPVLDGLSIPEAVGNIMAGGLDMPGV